MSTKKAIVKQIQGISFAGRSDSGHWITMDGPEEFGGSNSACRPKELLLIALGGCTGSDVVAILRKKRAPVQNLELHISADVREEHPQVFTTIHIEYIVKGNGLNSDDVERAIELSSTKYCAVSAMLKPNITITHSFRIESGDPS